MKDLTKKPKPTLETLLSEGVVLTGKGLKEKHKEQERQRALLQEAIEFEERNRRRKD